MMPIPGAAELTPEMTSSRAIATNCPVSTAAAARAREVEERSKPVTDINRAEVLSLNHPQPIKVAADATPTMPKSRPIVAVSKPVTRWMAGPRAGSPS